MDSFQWLRDLFTTTDSVAHIVLLYAIVIAIGVYLGKIKVFGISLGVTFVLFAGILAGHIGFTAPTPILTFMQDFGLILFVFMIGMQVGPGFFESFGTAGIKLNGLACQRGAEHGLPQRSTPDCLSLCLCLPPRCAGYHRRYYINKVYM